jgi:pimeloyl-ACP methyl ester carboxylesterase
MSFLTTPEGVRLRYTDRGEGGHTIVLVHGWKGSHRMWDPAVYRLMREFRVIAFDNRGMGESDKPAGPYDFGVLAADLGYVLEVLRADDVTLVGWSMGCTISLEYLARGGGRIGRLVLVNGPLKLTQTPEFPWTMTEEQLRGYLDDLAARWPDAEEEFSRGALRDPHSAYADLYYQVALQTPLEMAMRIVDEQVKIDHTTVLPTLQLPVLAAYGRHDPYYPIALAEYIAASAPKGSYVVFEESAHAPHYEEPDRFCEVIREFTLSPT